MQQFLSGKLDKLVTGILIAYASDSEVCRELVLDSTEKFFASILRLGCLIKSEKLSAMKNAIIIAKNSPGRTVQETFSINCGYIPVFVERKAASISKQNCERTSYN